MASAASIAECGDELHFLYFQSITGEILSTPANFLDSWAKIVLLDFPEILYTTYFDDSAPKETIQKLSFSRV